jgi:hypothetical protein
MKITIETKNHSEKKFLKIEDICDKLNCLVNANDFFFVWEKSLIKFKNCANISLHNKLIAIITLWTNENFFRHRCYIAIGENCIWLGSASKEFYNFLMSFDTLEDIQITFS